MTKAPNMPPGLLPSWIGTRAYDVDGARLGVVADLLFDETTRQPEWVVLELLRASDRFVLVPVAGARQHARGVVLAVHRRVVRTAPTSAAPPDGVASAHARKLARHYGRACGPGPWSGVAEPVAARGLEGQRVRMHVSRAA
jgi:hypothetical protein